MDGEVTMLMRMLVVGFMSVFISGCLQSHSTSVPVFKKADLSPYQFKQMFSGECEGAAAFGLSSSPIILKITGNHEYGVWISEVKEIDGSIDGDLYGSMIIGSLDTYKIDGETLIGYSDINHREHKCFAYFEVPGVLDQSLNLYQALAEKHAIRAPKNAPVKMPNTSLARAKTLCVELGVKPDTKDFGSCVIYFVYQGS